MTSLEWLDQKRDDGRTNIRRLAELIDVNGRGSGGYGVIAYVGGPYGRAGLNMDEFHELQHLNGVVTGMFIAEDQRNAEAFVGRIKAEIQRVEGETLAAAGRQEEGGQQK